MSKVAGSSAGFEILTMARPSPARSSNRNVWSRSLPRLRALAASRPWVTRAIAQASVVEYVGGGACRTGSMLAVGTVDMAVKGPGRAPMGWSRRTTPSSYAGSAGDCDVHVLVDRREGAAAQVPDVDDGGAAVEVVRLGVVAGATVGTDGRRAVGDVTVPGHRVDARPGM